MKKSFLLMAALLGAMIWTGCQRVEEESLPPETGEIPSDTGLRTLTLNAVKAESPATKGLEMDGDEATSTSLMSIWKAGETVHVYFGGSCIGELTASPNALDAHQATLSGTVNVAGITQGVSTLILFTPRESWDYTGQIGKLLVSDDATDSIEKKYHYTMASDVLVTGIDGSRVTTEDATFSNQQSIYRMSFRYLTAPETKTPITVESVTIESANGHLVQSQVLGGAVTEGPISVSLGTATTNPFFVALRNGDVVNDESLTFTVLDDNGVTYVGSKIIPSAYKPNGTFVSLKNATLTTRLEVSLSSTETTGEVF